MSPTLVEPVTKLAPVDESCRLLYISYRTMLYTERNQYLPVKLNGEIVNVLSLPSGHSYGRVPIHIFD